MRSEPTVTVLMPLKGFMPNFLEIALRSLLDQTSPRWELTVVVEQDEVSRLQQALAPTLEDPRVQLLGNEGRAFGGALNTGMRHASTDFVAILFADDLWSPQAVEVLEGNIQQHQDVDFFHSSRRIIDENGSAISRIHRSNQDVTLEDFASESPVKHLLCWRRSKGLAVGGLDESLEPVGIDDFDFPWTMAEQGAVFHAIPDCLYVYRDHRACPRLTTHVPRSVQRHAIVRSMRKHGLPEERIRARIAKADRSYLRAALYRNPAEKRLRETLGLRPRPWRDSYA